VRVAVPVAVACFVIERRKSVLGLLYHLSSAVAAAAAAVVFLSITQKLRRTLSIPRSRAAFREQLTNYAMYSVFDLEFSDNSYDESAKNHLSWV